MLIQQPGIYVRYIGMVWDWQWCWVVFYTAFMYFVDSTNVGSW